MKERIGWILAWFVAFQSHGIVLFGTADPAANTSAPDLPDLTDGGWDYEAINGGFLCTPISPYYFIGARHVGAASTITYRGENYQTVATWSGGTNGFIDLLIGQVDHPFPDWAPIYSTGGELGKTAVMIGRGTQRGPEVWAKCTNAIPSYTTQTVLTTITNYVDCSATNYTTNLIITYFTNYHKCVITNYVSVKDKRGNTKLVPVLTVTKCPTVTSNTKTNVVAAVTKQSCPVLSIVTTQVVTTSYTYNVTSHLAGWQLGNGDGRIRWGTNIVANVSATPGYGGSYAFYFLSGMGDDTGTVSSGDSSGAVFINDAGVWKLAGIISAQGGAGPYATDFGQPEYYGAYFNPAGLWQGQYLVTCGDPPSRPASSSYAIQVSSHLTWIKQITGIP